MTQMKKISLPIAILMSINIVIGAGFFLSASNVFNITGIFAPLAYLICGLMLLPLVKVLADLSRKYPTAGGIYVYTQKTLGEFWGFISGWGYFIGTAVGNALLLHAFSSMIQKLGFPLPFSTYFAPQTCQLLLDLIFIVIFTAINLLNITVFEKMQIGFTILKVIPLGLVLISMFFLFDMKNIAAAPIKPFGILESFPIVLFAYLGIESCCAIAHQIKSGERNAAKAMLVSLGIIIGIYSIVQFGLLAIVGVKSANPFFDVVPLITNNPFFIKYGNLIIKIALLSSYLGGFYGAYYANSWNLYALAKERKLKFAKSLTKLNKYHTPWASVIFQGALIALSLFVAFKNPISLMIMCSFGVVIAYLLSVITFFFAIPTRKYKNITGLLAVVSCTLLLIFSFKELADYGAQYLIPFLVILFSGLVFYRLSK